MRYSERFTVQAALISCTHEVCQFGPGVSLSSSTRNATDTRRRRRRPRIPDPSLAARSQLDPLCARLACGRWGAQLLAPAWAAWLPCPPVCTSMRPRRYRDRISNHGVTPHARKQARRYPNTSHRCPATVVGKVIASHDMLVVRGMRQAPSNSIR